MKYRSRPSAGRIAHCHYRVIETENGYVPQVSDQRSWLFMRKWYSVAEAMKHPGPATREAFRYAWEIANKYEREQP